MRGRFDAMVQRDPAEQGGRLRPRRVVNDLPVRGLHVLALRRRDRSGVRLRLDRRQGPFLQAEVVQDEEPQ